MFRYFVERSPSGEDRQGLFADLQIWQDADARAHFQRYPVISLTFKDAKYRTWAETIRAIQAIIAEELRRVRPLWDHEALDKSLRQSLHDLEHGAGDPSRFLILLSEAMAHTTQEPVVILIDEYDAPLLTAWEHGYYEEATSFFRSFLSAGLKDNPHLFRGVLTGILRIAKESMFSGLNNVIAYTLLRQDAAEPFGFTEAEVTALLAQVGRLDELGEVQSWYNGYRFGPATVYNPWSILNFLSRPGQPCEPYWLNTSDNVLVRSLLLGQGSLRLDMEALLIGGSIEKEIDDNVVLRDLRGEDIWSLLLFSGYLKPTALRIARGRTYATLKIPNEEVRILWEDTFREWLQNKAGSLAPLHMALLSGDAPLLEQILTDMLELHVSQHDVKATQDEAFYHAFVLGLLVSLEPTHRVRSNREVAYGRADVLVIPASPGQPGVVLEFKRKEKDRTLEGMAQDALKQIQDRKYIRELEAAGASPIHALGIAFSGKDVVVRGA